MATTLLLPCHVDSLQSLSDCVPENTKSMVVVALDHSRFVWRVVAPGMFFRSHGEGIASSTLLSSDRVARHMTTCLCNFSSMHGRLWRIRRDDLPVVSSSTEKILEQQQRSFKDEKVTGDHIADPVPDCLFKKRILKFRMQKYPGLGPDVAVLILPPIHENIEYTWEERVIRLEHDRIRAQSVAGFYSTLGGGYFMTRRLQTATALAREQQRIALVLGDKEMYYKCSINQAYSHIYRGHFKQARHLILQVWIALAHEKHFDEKLVLQNMCRSAMLFRKRVRMASKHVPEVDGGRSLFDDFSRIRVIKEDQSSTDDLAAMTR